jgi:orotate phosphoribosyltransferase
MTSLHDDLKHAGLVRVAKPGDKPFQLKSGATSTSYVDLKALAAHPQVSVNVVCISRAVHTLQIDSRSRSMD